MTALLKPEDQMTIEEFLAFTASRPDEERWELIEGVPHMNVSPTNWHQMIALSIGSAMRSEAMRLNATWCPSSVLARRCRYRRRACRSPMYKYSSMA